jgi:Uri superfamily endonuclease
MDKLTLEEIQQANGVSNISSHMYVWHDADGTITGISNYAYDGAYLEVAKTRLVDFLNGKKDYYRYKIDYFKFDQALQTKDKTVEIASALIYELPHVESIGLVDCTIVHNSSLQHWEFVLTDYAKGMLLQINPSTIFEFYLTQLKDPHFLYGTVTIDAMQLLNENKVEFKSEIENNIDSISISTYGYFKSYGLLVL